MTDRPNVLLIFTDQQRADTIAALGNGVIRTPNLDRLCRGGVAFTSAYSPSPVCVSARCSLMYGQYPLNTACYENGYPMPTDGRPSFADALTQAGYRTHAIGKCHFTPDGQALRGFQSRQTQGEIPRSPDVDDYLTFLHGAGFGHICDPHGVRGEMYYVPQVAQMPAELHPTAWVGEQTAQFIEGAAAGESDRPWMLFSSYIHPHPPFAPPNPWHKLYRHALMPLPNVPADTESLHTYINRHQNRYKYRDQGIDRNLLRGQKAHYYATISFIDYQVGRTLETLAKTGQLDNTLIVYTSDHGELLGDYNCFGKRSMHDAASRVPVIAHLPGRFDGGRICDRPVSLVDVAPTIVSAAGAEMPAGQLDGADLAEMAAGANEREMVFSQHAKAGRATYMAVGERWKYFYSAADDREFLFDRVADPLETRNRAGVTFCRAARDEIKAALIAHLRAGGEADALDGDDWRKYPRLDVPEDPDAGLLVQDHPWADTNIPGYTD
jgi:choline-sulfatase